MTSTSRKAFFLVSILVVIPIVTTSLIWGSSPENDDDSVYKYLSVFSDVLNLIGQAYVETTEVSDLIDGALAGATDALDPFALYIPEQQIENFAAAAATRDAGLNGLTIVGERGLIRVIGVEKGSAADQAGIERWDFIAELGGEATRGMPIWRVWQETGATSGTLDLVVLRGVEKIDVVMERGKPSPSSLRKEELEGIPLLGFNRFDQQSITELGQYLGELESGELILDLRGVGGMDVHVAYQAAGFLTQGNLGSKIHQGESMDTYAGSEPSLWSGRLVALVDPGTLGAAELFASILAQNEAAELVGLPTFGWAGEQKLIALESGGQLWLTTSYYTGPDGEPHDQSLAPEHLLTARNRRLADRDLTIDELIERKALEVLQSEEPKEIPEAA